MSYSSVQDVRNALAPGGVDTDKASAAELSDAQLQDAINEADARIDTYLPRGYRVPVVYDTELDEEVTVSLIRYWSRNIAAYLASLTHYQNTDMVEDEPIRLRYELTISELDRARSGALVLPETDDDAAYLGFGPSVFNQYEPSLFPTDPRFDSPHPLIWVGQARGL